MNPPENPVRTGKENPAEEVARLRKELDERTSLAEDRLSRLKYLQADFDNYRRWSEKEKEAVIAHANENLLRDLLVILDDFEHALPALAEEKNREGMQMVYRKLTKILREYGLEPIVCIGEKFDPHIHEAICAEPCGKKPGIVLEDLGRGYRLRSKVIRPSKVKIAERAQDAKESGE